MIKLIFVMINADRLSCRLRDSQAAAGNTCPKLAGGSTVVGRLSWVVGALHRVLQGCLNTDAKSTAGLQLESEVSGLWSGLVPAWLMVWASTNLAYGLG